MNENESWNGRKLYCYMCGHFWTVRNDKPPRTCPKCDSHNWNDKKLNQFMCRRCGFVWRNRVDDPKKCPRCFSTKWNEMTFKLQCKRCGHKWMSTNPEGSKGAKVCPACKSPNWNEPPKTLRCSNCWTVYNHQKKGSQCPNCSGKQKGLAVKNYQCEFCHAEWTSLSTNTPICPNCGMPLNLLPTFALEGSATLWMNGFVKLTYTDLYDYGCIYLWHDDYPVTAIGLETFLKGTRLTVSDITIRALSIEYDEFWGGVADYIYEHRDEYRENIPYFMKRLGLCEEDAEVLALHFMGFCPEVIAIRLQRPIRDIRTVFDRIMKAYSDNGIVVNDSIFTEGPIALYESARV